MDLKISIFALIWKRIWGGKQAVFDYFLDKGNGYGIFGLAYV